MTSAQRSQHPNAALLRWLLRVQFLGGIVMLVGGLLAYFAADRIPRWASGLFIACAALVIGGLLWEVRARRRRRR